MKIPKILHLTCKDKSDITNDIHSNCVERFRKIYTDYEIRIRDNNDIFEMIGEDYPEYIEQIKTIKIGAVLADIYRYYILYKEGGIYADMDCYAHMNIDTLFTEKNYHGDEKNLVFHKKYDTNDVQEQCDCKEFLFQNEDIELYVCNGHTVVEDKHKVVLCYEFHPDYTNCNKTGICQWFMLSEPKQPLMHKILNECFHNLDTLTNLNINSASYIKTVLESCGPALVTRIVFDSSEEELDSIKILPSEYFCVGSYGLKKTNKSYIEHLYTSTWHPVNMRKRSKNGVLVRKTFSTTQFNQKNTSSHHRRMFGGKKTGNFKLI